MRNVKAHDELNVETLSWENIWLHEIHDAADEGGERVEVPTGNYSLTEPSGTRLQRRLERLANRWLAVGDDEIAF